MSCSVRVQGWSGSGLAKQQGVVPATELLQHGLAHPALVRNGSAAPYACSWH